MVLNYNKIREAIKNIKSTLLTRGMHKNEKNSHLHVDFSNKLYII